LFLVIDFIITTQSCFLCLRVWLSALPYQPIGHSPRLSDRHSKKHSHTPHSLTDNMEIICSSFTGKKEKERST